jgi:hypothetical protein
MSKNTPKGVFNFMPACFILGLKFIIYIFLHKVEIKDKRPHLKGGGIVQKSFTFVIPYPF